VDEYFGFLTMACFGFGVCFETPLVMLALAWAGLITPEGVIKYWRHAVLTMVVLGAVFTPPDPVTQIMLASMMAGLFFLGYWLMKLVVNRKEE
jgi:sec-independent protein translocase protein TatC